MKKIFLLLFACILSLVYTNAQETIVKWDFDASTLSPTIGTGVVAPIGEVIGTFPSGNPSSGKGYGTSGYPAAIVGNQTAGISLAFSTLGFSSIQLNLDVRHSNTAGNKEIFLLSTNNGETFTAIDSFTVTIGDVFNKRNIDLTSKKIEANNNPNVVLKIVTAFDGASYKATTATSNYATTGTLRFDNIVLTGTAGASGKPVVNLSFNKNTAFEGETIIITAKSSKVLASNETFDLVLTPSAELQNADYLLSKTTLTMLAGFDTATSTLVIVKDALAENTETLTIMLTTTSTAVELGSSKSQTLTIAANDLPFTKIHIIQGDGFASTLSGIVTVEGIVTNTSLGIDGYGGFYMQEEDIDKDNNNATSEGIWIFTTTTFAGAVKQGDKVQVTGTVNENFGQTELADPTVAIISSANPLPTAIAINIPLQTPTVWENYEGMLVKIINSMYVSENYNLGRYGELVLKADARMYNATVLVDPNDNPASGNNFSGNSNVAAIDSYKMDNASKTILLDDNSNKELPNPIPFLDPLENTIRSGSSVNNLEAIVGYGFGKYRLQPNGKITWNYNKRPMSPPAVGANNVKIASFNVENLFNGVDNIFTPANSRGAQSLAEFKRQIAKTMRAVHALNADILGMIELENDGFGESSIIKTLTDSLNQLAGSGTYAFITSPSKTIANNNAGLLGTDQIRCAIIYKLKAVTPVGDYELDESALFNRVPLAQTFKLNSNGGKFTIMVNHFKSKGCNGATGLNADQKDGQACYNENRKIQTEAAIAFANRMIAAKGDSDLVILGDLNAYTQEDPIDLLRSKGWVDMFEGRLSYSFVFMGEAGSLDHAFATPSLSRQVTGAEKWHINCDEPNVISYTFNDESAKKTKTVDLYATTPFRVSDHDPILIGLQVKPETITGNLAEESSKIKISPNPFQDFIQIENISSGAQLEIYDLLGKQYFSEKFNISKIDTSKLPNGLYIIKIQDEKEVVFKTMIKK